MKFLRLFPIILCMPLVGLPGLHAMQPGVSRARDSMSGPGACSPGDMASTLQAARRFGRPHIRSVALANANCRNNPRPNAYILHVLRRGTEVAVVSMIGDWCSVSQGLIWVRCDFLQPPPGGWAAARGRLPQDWIDGDNLDD